MRLLLSACIVAAMTSAPTFAQDIQPELGQWQWGVALSTINLDQQQATKSGINDNAAGLALYGMYVKHDWITTLTMEYMKYSDNNKFKQTVEGEGWANNGDRSTQTSNASAGTLSVATGKFWRIGDKQDIVITAQAGFSVVTASERKIENCRNCYSEDISIDGGAFFKTSISKNLETVSFGLQLTQYLASDGIKQNIGFSLQSAF